MLCSLQCTELSSGRKCQWRFTRKPFLTAKCACATRETVQRSLCTCLPEVFTRLGAHAFQTPAPAACCSTRQRECPHRRRHSGLPGRKWRSAGPPSPVFPGLWPLCAFFPFPHVTCRASDKQHRNTSCRYNFKKLLLTQLPL